MDRTFKGRSIAQSFDWKLVGAYLLLVFIGLLNIYAPSIRPNPADSSQ